MVLDGAIRVGGTVVEALNSLGRDGGEAGESGDGGGRTHVEQCSRYYCVIDVEVMYALFEAMRVFSLLQSCLGCVGVKRNRVERRTKL